MNLKKGSESLKQIQTEDIKGSPYSIWETI